MVSRLHALAVAVVLIALGELSGSALAARRRVDSEQDLLARIQREQNRVKKAKYEIRLARVKLLQAINAYDQGNLERCQTLLAAYLSRVKSSWETLRSSGRQAARQPQGFKELDISLRQDSRLLEDLIHRVPFNDRGAVEKVAREAEQIRSEVLKALFPAERPRGAGNTFAGPRWPHFSTGRLWG